MEIFCPNNHLILEASTCSKCGWQRPLGGKIGKPLWGPTDMLAGLGGESREKFATMSSIGDTLLLSPRSNELVGVSLLTGNVMWRNAVPVGKKVVSIQSEAGRGFVVLQDTHSLMECVEYGSINLIDPENGQLSLFWQAPSHDLTPPLFWKDRIFVRTAESRLYALEGQHPNRILWQYPLDTWWAATLLTVSDTLILLDGNAMFGEGWLVGVDAEDGARLWRHKLDGMPGKPVTGNDSQVFVLDSRKNLLAANARSGEENWQKEFSHFYTVPCVNKQQVFVVARGSKDAQAEDHYLLLALSAETGNVDWQTPLSSRVRITPMLAEDTLLVGGDDGVLRAFNAHNGHTMWEYKLGHEEDPIQTQLYLAGDLVLLGTYFGQLAAVSIRQPAEILESPQSYFENEDWKMAANAYALQADYGAAAEIYTDKISAVDKAIQLYEKGKDFQRAARLAYDTALYSKALENFRKAGDGLGEAETLLVMGDKEGASKLFYELGEPARAAKLMEEAGKLKLATQYYREAGMTGDYLRLVTKTILDHSEVEKLRAGGNFETAACWEMANKQYVEAAKDFREIEKEYEELEALKKHLENNREAVEQWVWQRVAELGEGQGDLVAAANAWMKLDRPDDAGAAFLKMAEILTSQLPQALEAISSKDKAEISTRYQQAAEAFKEAGLTEKEEFCRHQVRRYQQLPKVIILQVESSSGFREMEWNMLTLTAQNIGFGRAIEVTFKIGASRFEVQEESRTFSFNLSSDLNRQQVLHLRPLKDQYGESVPLEIHWSWKDHRGRVYQDSGSIPVKVVPQRDTESAVPIVYQFQNVENLVQGTQIKGDKVEQKGDKVVINRVTGENNKQGVDVQTAQGDSVQINRNAGQNGQDHSLSRVCPNCGRTIGTSARFCVYCRLDLAGDGRG